MALLIVTGAAGFVGRHLAERLVADGHDVVGIDRRCDPVVGTRAWLTTDLADPDDTVADALRAADAVFHLAGCPGVRTRGQQVARRRHRDNVVAGRRVLAATPAHTPVVVTSSSSVYGGAVLLPGRLRACREGDRVRPRGGYARSKVALEAACARRAAAGGHVAVARPFTVAGERQRPDMAIASWLRAARSGQPLRLLGAPDRVRDVTDVRDVVEGLVRLAWRGVASTVNLGTGRGWRLDEIVAAVATVTATAPQIAIEPVSAHEPPATLADVRRCRRLLGYVPRTDLHALVERQAAAVTAPAQAPPLSLSAERCDDPVHQPGVLLEERGAFPLEL